MKCPFCSFEESKVIDSRPTDEGQRIRRRRECLSCGKRFTTYEIIESLPIIVIKKDKSRETCNRDKLMTGLLRACEKRPVSIDTLDNMIDEIETTLQNSLDREVSSEKIGQLVMEKLGGGGHMSIAGAQLTDCTIDQAINKIKLTLDNMIKDGEI